jgi:hypothetical protein
MAITINDNVTKNDLANTLINRIETANTANLVIRNSVNATIATVPFGTQSSRFGIPSNGIATSQSFSNVIATSSGVANNFTLVADGNVILSGTITTTGNGGDLTIANTTIQVGGTVQMGILTLKAPNS